MLRATVAMVNKTKTKKNGKSSQLSSNIESNCSLSKLINIKYWIKNIVNFKKEKDYWENQNLKNIICTMETENYY